MQQSRFYLGRHKPEPHCDGVIDDKNGACIVVVGGCVTAEGWMCLNGWALVTNPSCYGALICGSHLLLVRHVATAGGSSIAVADISSTRIPRCAATRSDGPVSTAVTRARRFDICSTDT